MKTIEEQLDDMLPPDVQRRLRRKRASTEHYRKVSASLRRLGRIGPTVAEATATLKAAVAALRDD